MAKLLVSELSYPSTELLEDINIEDNPSSCPSKPLLHLRLRLCLVALDGYWPEVSYLLSAPFELEVCTPLG
jgi:hypothetical protein